MTDHRAAVCLFMPTAPAVCPCKRSLLLAAAALLVALHALPGHAHAEEPAKLPDALARLLKKGDDRPKDPEESLARPKRPVDPKSANTPALADQLAWHGFHQNARDAYNRILGDLPPATTQPLRTALEQPDNPSAWIAAACLIGLAEIDAATGNYDQALERTAELPLEQIIARDPALATRLLHTRVRVFLETGQYAPAEQLVQSALKLDPQSLLARYLLARLHAEQNRPDALLATLEPVFERFRRTPPRTIDDRYWGGKSLYLFFQTRGTLTSRLLGPVLQDYYQRIYDRENLQHWPARLAAADMLANAYNLREATDDVMAALRINPRLADALVLLARMDLENWQFERIDRRIERALKINPRHTEALYIRAKARLSERQFQQAIDTAEQVLAINPRHVRAAAVRIGAIYRQYQDQRAAQELAKLEEWAPSDPRAYFEIAEALANGRQFEPAEAYYKRAIELAPQWALARNGLGSVYMQTGEDLLAREQLDASFRIDSYHRQTYNMLELLDYLQGKSKDSFQTRESPNFILRYDREKDAVIGEFYLDFLESIHDEIAQDFEWEPPAKTIIEIYPTQQKFAVRITGEPWIPTVGACTGRVIAMVAPRESAGAGTYNWAAVLRHEYTHTVTLGATRNRIPHWFTEALAVASENTPRPWDWCELLTMAVRQNELFPVSQLDWGFQRPKKAYSRTLAYAQSHWAYEFIVELRGFDAITAMIEGFREGKPQSQVLLDALDMSESEFDARFHDWAIEQARAWGLRVEPLREPAQIRKDLRTTPNDPTLLAELAVALIAQDNVADAITAADKALKLLRDANTLAAGARAYFTQSQQEKITPARKEKALDRALELATELTTVDPTKPIGPLICWNILIQRENGEQLAEPFIRMYQHAMPLNPESYRLLAGIYLRGKQPDKALTQLIALANMQPHEPAIPRQAADLLAARQEFARAAEWAYRSILIDPYHAETHFKRGQWLERTMQLTGALKAYRTSTLLEPANQRFQAALNDLSRRLGSN